jgi:hypothetical protein
MGLVHPDLAAQNLWTTAARQLGARHSPMKIFALSLTASALMIPAAGGAEILLNGATSTSQWGFRTFLDATAAGSRAWLLNNSNSPVMPIQTGGALTSVTPVALTLGGAPDLTITGSLHAPLSGFTWTGDPDIVARDAFTNGSGYHTGGGSMSLNIPSSIATTGQLYHVEVLAFAGFGLDRRFNVAANGTTYATNWTLIADAPNNYNDVLEFDIIANGAGITLNIDPGTDGGVDTNPFIHAIAITPVVPEPGSTALLAGAGLLILRRRSRRA